MKKLFLGLLIAFSLTQLSAQDAPPPPKAPNAPKDTTQLMEYTAKYKFPDGSPVTEITVVIENGILMAQTAMGNTEFKKTENKDVFEVVAYSGTATFKRNPDGKIVGLVIQVNNIEMEGVRE